MMYFTLNILGGILILQSLTTVHGQTFLEIPQNTSVPIGRNATFTCSAVEESPDVMWIIVIGDRGYDPHISLADNEALRDKGIIIEPEASSPSNNRSLTIPATEEKNGTEVTCRLGFSLKNATLTVLGPPPPPEIKWKSFTENNTILISWEPPFTWPDYPIQYYTVTVQDKENSTLDRHNQTAAKLTYLYNLSTQPQKCVTYIFGVTATSDIGESDMGSVEGGFIIGQIDDSSIRITTLSTQKSALVRIEIDLPGGCDGVDLTADKYDYFAMIQNPNSTLVWKDNNTYSPGDTVEDEVGLAIDTTYTLSITITGATDTGVAETSTSSRFVVTQQESEMGIKVLIIVIVGSVVGATVCVIVVIIFIACAKAHRKRKQRNRVVTFAPPQVDNPIYEGSSEYEDLEGYQTHFPETSYAVAGPPTLPPPRPLNGKCDSLCPEKPERVSRSSEECYTVMNPVGTVSSEDRPDHKALAEGNRYVITEC